MTRTTTSPPHAPIPAGSTSTDPTSDRSLRTPALVAGVGLLVLAVLSAWANFGVVEALVTETDPATTARDILASESIFRIGTVALLLVAILDIVVAWALGAFFAPVHRGVSAVAAWLRAVYGGVFMIAIIQLAGALNVLEDIGTSTAFSTEQLQAEALGRIESFHLMWDAGLLIFGLHLVLLGYLAYRSTYVPRLLGVLLVVAGLGYLIDSFGMLLAPGSLPEVALYTFIGEALLLVWLLVKGRTVTVAPREGSVA
jgi:hypothetical protein